MINNEQDIIDALSPLGVGIYHVRAPMHAEIPHIIFQQVGGRPSNTLCGNTTKQNARFRFSAHSTVSIESTNLIRKLESILTAEPIRAVSLGSLSSEDNSATLRYVARQDFSIWFSATPIL